MAVSDPSWAGVRGQGALVYEVYSVNKDKDASPSLISLLSSLLLMYFSLLVPKLVSLRAIQTFLALP